MAAMISPAPTTTQILHGQIDPMSVYDLADLQSAVRALETTSLVARLSAIAGHQIDLVGRFMPAKLQQYGARATTLALRAALHTALTSLDKQQRPASRRLHKGLAAASGIVGGAFGLPGLLVELPVSTTVMLRAIADVARDQGEDLSQPESALACLEVFALGGARATGASIESSYFAVRSLLAQSVSEAAKFVLSQQVINEGAPVLVKFISQIAARFGVVVSQKIVAQAVPLLGAASAAALNFAFADHFQRLAHGHFTVRRLERHYGRLLVREEYERLSKKFREK